MLSKKAFMYSNKLLLLNKIPYTGATQSYSEMFTSSERLVNCMLHLKLLWMKQKLTSG